MAQAQPYYVEGGDNSVLRTVLYETWNSMCYICRVSKAYEDMQIDHIIPQSSTPEELESFKKRFKLEDDFNIHGLPNLAPICGPCNGSGRKGSQQDLLELPIFAIQLKKAASYETKVFKDMLAFDNSREVNKAFLRITHSNPHEAGNTAAFEQYSESVVQTIALFDESKINYISTFVTSDEHRVSLDSSGRTAKAVLEEVLGADLDDAINEAMDEVQQHMGRELVNELEGWQGADVYPTVGDPTWDWFDYEVDGLSFERDHGMLLFKLTGSVSGRGTSDIAQSPPDGGDELVSRQGEVSVLAERFQVVGQWSVRFNSAQADSWDAQMDTWDPDVWVE